jgi:hypothetical protein
VGRLRGRRDAAARGGPLIEMAPLVVLYELSIVLARIFRVKEIEEPAPLV